MDNYLFSGSGLSWRLTFAAALKGVPHRERLLRPHPDDLRAERFLRLGPRGKVPALVDGDVVLPESIAAMAYLDRKHTEPPLFGRSPEKTGRIWRIILNFGLYVAHIWTTKLTVPIVSGQVASREAQIRERSEAAHREIAGPDATLGDNPRFVGNAISAADIAISPMLEAAICFSGKEAVRHLDLATPRTDERHPPRRIACPDEGAACLLPVLPSLLEENRQ